MLCTTPFEVTARNIARVLGLPDYPFLTVQHPMRTAGDAANYVARLQQVGVRISEALAEARELAGRDLIPPRFILSATITQMRRFVEADSLGYLSLDALSRAVGDTKNRYCYSCYTGEYPTSLVQIEQPAAARS